MITEYIKYKLKSSFEVNNTHLSYSTTLSNGIKYYRDNECYELHLPNKILAVEVYLSYYEDELLAITYNTISQNIDYLVELINSFANHEDEYLFEDILGGNSDLFCIQNGIAIHLNNRTDSTIDFKIAVPINERKNKVFV